jgi:hypothetical protein
MTNAEILVLRDIVNGIENLAVSLDALEAVLIHKGILTNGEFDLQKPAHVPNVLADLAALRTAIASLPVKG